MLFTEPSFLFIFLPVCLLLQFAIKNTAAKNILLLIMSLLFYAWGEPVYVLLMIAVSLISWGLCLRLCRAVNKKPLLAAALIAALLPLLFFKYGQMLLDIVNMVPGLYFTMPAVSLPIGISFYTFQIISYIVDVYRGDADVQKNPFYFMLYISLFPQLIAGPIVRYTEVEKQLNYREITAPMFSEGVYRFLIGLGKKVLLANTVGKTVTDILSVSVSELGMLGAWGAMLCYAFQIYFDFSGYSDMAIGLGKMLGFTYNENFNYPYIASSIKEFWRRWHISMNTFFRDYVYIPLGGNRRRQYFNMFVVWALTGLWHGAGLNFVLWGLYFFVLLSIEKLFMKKIAIPRGIAVPATFILVVIGWVFFYFEDMTECLTMLKIMFGGGAFTDPLSGQLLYASIPAILICAVFSTPLISKLKQRISSSIPEGLNICLASVFTAVMLLVCTAVIIGSSYNPFLYFKF